MRRGILRRSEGLSRNEDSMPIRSWVILILILLGVGILYKENGDPAILGWGCFALAFIYARLTGVGRWF